MAGKNKWVVGIGASAGGLESLEHFFKNCPDNLNASYIVIQHLSTQYKSMMEDLINRYTSMPVHMIFNDMAIEKNHIYLIPAGKLLTIENDKLYLTDKLKDTFHLPIDVFFKSLADNSTSHAIGVILSGTGTDGSRGAVAINAQGGMVIAQEPTDAKFDGMPKSLIETGIVDYKLTAKVIPEYIAQHIQHPTSGPKTVLSASTLPNQLDIQNDLDAIFQILAVEVDINFREYKWATISRRIERRMQVNRIASLSEYRHKLDNEPSEVLALKKELLIPVTSFFRDEEVFALLTEKIIPEMIESITSTDGIRIWIAGVSTGEEAYTIAMLFLEALAKTQSYIPLKIFATDINSHSLEYASQASYPESIASEVPDTFLKRYFILDNGRYNIIPELRQCVVFAKHNLLTAPPFTNMDFVSCRNTLIYFKAEAQNIALQKLQYALNGSGVLMLGKSESLTANINKFATIDSKCKLFEATEKVNIRDLDSRTLKTQYSQPHHSSSPVQPTMSSYVEQANSYLNKKFMPLSVLVDDDINVIHVFGEPENFFKVRAGSLNTNLTNLIDEKLSPVVAALFYRLKKEKTEISSENASFTQDGQAITVNIHAAPIRANKGNYQYLFSFHTIKTNSTTSAELVLNTVDDGLKQRNELLESELQATRESLQTTIEELETTNEELQATNEELMASNEELQSSNEELQSVNEELNTVNAEYHEKLNILNQINADLDAMGKATSIATVFVNEKIQITRYTPDARSIFKFRDLDIGRPLNEVSHILNYEQLYDDINEVAENSITKEREVMAKDGRFFLVRIVFYQLTAYTKGVVISFIDISAIKKSQDLQMVIDALPEHISVLSRSGEILMVNKAWIKFAKANGDPSGNYTGVGTNYLNVCQNSSQDQVALNAYKSVKSVLEGTLDRTYLEYPCHSETEQRWFAMETISITHDTFAAVVSHFNISAWKIKMEQDK